MHCWEVPGYSPNVININKVIDKISNFHDIAPNFTFSQKS